MQTRPSTTTAEVTNAPVVRVFVSSTFHDMHAERDYLNRVVWPELRNRCLRRGVEFVGVDLRWGVTRDDAEQQRALAICLDEIERCHYLVAILGERYGWVPPPDAIPSDLFETVRGLSAATDVFDQWYALDSFANPPLYRLRAGSIPDRIGQRLTALWEDHGLPGAGASATAREIWHGLDRLGSERTLFYFRESDPPPPVPPALTLIEEDGTRRARLADLKQAIRRRAGASIRAYRVVTGALPGEETRPLIDEHGTLSLSGLDAWGERLQEDLWAAIEPRLPHAGRRSSVDDRQRASHERFLIERTHLFVGRHALLERMLAYVDDLDDRQPLVVTGAPGSGKSALIAECARRCRHRGGDALVLPHFIGAAPGSAALLETIRALCDALRTGASLDEEVPADRDELLRTLPLFLEKAGKRRPVILLIDALNQLAAQPAVDHSWLPLRLPLNTRLIVSTLDGSILEQLRRHAEPNNVITVPGLPVGDRLELVREALARRGKRLTPNQMARLLDAHARPDVNLPLYILVALEELTLFGSFEALDTRIEQLPPTLPALFDQVLDRLEQDHGQEETASVLRLIAASRDGLLESEILDLMDRHGPAWPRLRWVRLYRALEFYLKRIDEESGEGLLDFYHDQLRHAVYNRYFGMKTPAAPPTAALLNSHECLASYFAAVARAADAPHAWHTERPRALSELPYHLANSRQWSPLLMLLTDFDFAQVKVSTAGPTPLIQDFDLAVTSSGVFTPVQTEALELIQGGLRLSAVPVGRDANQLAGQMLGRLCDFEHDDVQRFLDAARRWRGAPWLRPVNGCLAAPGGSLVRTLIGHEAGKHVAVTPDGRRAMATVAGHLQVWNVGSGTLERTLADKYDAPLATTPDGREVVGSGPEGTLRVWDIESGEITRVLEGQAGKVAAVAVSRDGRFVVTGSTVFDARVRITPTVQVWELATGRVVHRFTGHGGYGVRAVAIAPDGAIIVSAAEDSTARIWVPSSTEPRHILRHDYFVVTAVAITPDGKLALTTCADGSVTVWDVQTGTKMRAFTCPRQRTTRVTPYVNAMALTADGGTAVMAMMDETLRMWDAGSGEFGPVLSGHTDEVVDVAAAADGSVVVSTSSDRTVRVWSVGAQTGRAAPHGHVSRITSLALTPSGETTISASWDHTMRIWDTRTGRHRRVLKGHGESVNAVMVTRDGERVVSSSSDRTIRVWNLASRQVERSFQGGTEGEWPTTRVAELTADGKWLVNAALSGLVAVHRVKSGSKVWTATGEWRARYIAVAPDLTRVVLCTDDGDVLTWDGRTGSPTRPLRVADPDGWIVAITPDSRQAVVGYGNGTLRVWHLKSGTRAHTLAGHRAVITAIAITADGRYAVSADKDGALRSWDLRTGAAQARMIGHTNRIWSLAAAPDGRHVVSGSADHTIRAWDVRSGDGLATLVTEGDVWACGFGPDSRTVVAGGDSGRVHFLELVDGTTPLST